MKFKTFWQLAQELYEINPHNCWHYLTALRGPDGVVERGTAWSTKCLFTGPLRGRNRWVLDAVDFLGAFRVGPEFRNNMIEKLWNETWIEHYINHIYDAWRVINPTIAGFVLEMVDAKSNEDWLCFQDNCKYYISGVIDWLEDGMPVSTREEASL